MRLEFLFFLLVFNVSAQIGTGQWRLHTPANKALDVVAFNDRVYTAYISGVAEYDFSSGESSMWDDVNGLSDIKISCLGKSNSDNSLFIAYENGNLDHLKNNTVINIPAINLAQVQGSKKIYRLVEYQNYIYAATGFAIVKIDPLKNEVRDTYYPTNGNAAIIDIAFLNDSIYALTDDRMYRGALSNPALADPLQWVTDSRVTQQPSNTYSEIEVFNNDLLVCLKVNGFGMDSVYRVTNAGMEVEIMESTSMEINSLDIINGKLAVNFYSGIFLYNSDYSKFDSFYNYTFGTEMNVNRVQYSDGYYWFADNVYGLVRFMDNWNNQSLNISGPPSGDFFKMDWSDGRLAIASGGLSGVAQTFNRSGVFFFENEKWSYINTSNSDLWNNADIWDFISVSIHPGDKEKVAVGTYSQVPLSIIDASNVTDTLTPFNADISTTSLLNNSTLLSAVKYDENGNLWMLNGYSLHPLRVLTIDGEWYKFSLGSAANNKYTEELEMDYNGNKWFSISGVGLYGYKDNGTPSSSSDDSFVLLNKGENSGALPSNEVTAIAVDFDNEIWIGTDNGLAILYNSESAFGASPGDYNASRIKLEYEGNVEYLLGDSYITDIEIDGGNRKWIAIANAGIVLLSADGQEILEQHTKENSPLISNNIIDMELDMTTGELYIITDQGLVSYRTDASYDDSDYSGLTIFPNPVRADFDGPITIQGIRYDSDVKITDVAGNLIYKTTSNGGTATWNGKTLQGERVQTGVYLIWTAMNDGKSRKVGKVLVIN